MALMNTAERYGRVAQFFHWATAGLILTLIPLGVIMHEWPNQPAETLETKIWLYSLHKTLGVTVLAIAVLRILWALANPKPEPLHPERRAETFAAELVHWMLYAGIIIAPVAGLLHHAASVGFAPIWWPFGQDLPFVPKSEGLAVAFGYMHWIAAVLIALSLVGHIGGALKHHFIDQDKTLKRMLAGGDEIILTPAQSEPRFNGVPASAAALITLVALGASGTYGWNVVHGSKAVAAPLAAATTQTGADSWVVDQDNSTLAISVDQLGSPVEGVFNDWAASIQFDPENLADASASVTINTGSLTIGTVSQQATSSDFLAVDAHPIATFETTAFRAVGGTDYEADGVLTIKGVEQPVVLPFSLVIDGDTATMAGQVVIDRMQFTVGEGSYETADTVGLSVTISVDLVAQRAAATNENAGS